MSTACAPRSDSSRPAATSPARRAGSPAATCSPQAPRPPGPLARHPRDLALLLHALTTPAPAENSPWHVRLPTPQRTIGELRVAVWADDPNCPVDSATARALDTVEQALASAGATVHRTKGPVDFADSLRLFEQLLHATTTAATDDASAAAELAAAQALGRVSKVPPAPRRLARTLAALPKRPNSSAIR
ncbi:amidase family protein, partial [Streptomyces antibioticus]|uniref:amidase family protein n=1 Tax=Streptomyces antibioticus TaxID=1890 RepID=UPI0033AC21AB